MKTMKRITESKNIISRVFPVLIGMLLVGCGESTSPVTHSIVANMAEKTRLCSFNPAVGDQVADNKKSCQAESETQSMTIDELNAAARNGDTNATYELGLRYASGNGVEPDFSKAIELVEKAADAGHATAMLDLGNCFLAGKGVKKNLQKAVKYFTRSADAEHTLSLIHI